MLTPTLSNIGLRRIMLGIVPVMVLFSAVAATAAVISGDFKIGSSAPVTITQVEIAKPAGAVGDVMIAIIAVNGGSVAHITPPSGWNDVVTAENDTNVKLQTYWRVRKTKEPATYIWTVDGQTTAKGAIVSYHNVDIGAGFDTDIVNSGYGTQATTGSINTNFPNEQILTIFATDVGLPPNAGNYFSTPTGSTEKFDVSNTPFGPSLALSEFVQPNAGPMPVKTATISSAGNKPRNWVSIQIALRNPDYIDPVAYWKLDGNSNDAVGSNNGTDTNVTYSTDDGKINQGANFDGSSSETNLANIIQGPGNFTVMAWIKTTSDGLIIGQHQTPISTRWELSVVSGKVVFRNIVEDVEANRVTGNTSVDDGNWHLVGVTLNNDAYSLIVDGNFDGSLFATPMSYSGDLAEIGYDRVNNDNHFKGSIDEVGVWNHTINGPGILALYNAGHGRQYPF